LRRLAATNFSAHKEAAVGAGKKVRDGEGAIAGTRAACAPRQFRDPRWLFTRERLQAVNS
jgi:hypothetical protein